VAGVTTVVGILVGLAAWAVLDRGGRTAARAVRGGSGPGAAVPRAGTGPPGRDRFALGRLRRRRGPQGVELVRVVVTQVGALLRSGASPGAAWERATGVRVDPSGVPRVDDLARHLGSTATARAVVAACRLAGDVGSPLVSVLEEVAASLAADAEAQAARDAALAGPRATTRVLLWLPAVGVLLGYVLGADPVATALDGGIGTVGVLLGVLLLLAGRAWSGRLVAHARAAGDEP
jgi:tight adherence protein B